MNMSNSSMTDLSYYPGCSLATTAKENNRSLIFLFQHLGFNLVELEDWNCCGSSSAHSVDNDLAFDLACRNLSLAPPGRPLLVACPSCILRLRHAHLQLKQDPVARDRYEEKWGKPYNAGLEILHFFDFLDNLDLLKFAEVNRQKLSGLKFVTYYGCMLARPPAMRNEKNYHGVMEKILSSLGATPINWAYSSRCCGTFLTVARPDVVTPVVNEIMQGAIKSDADFIVTACAMCHMNLEVRSTSKQKIPILHFSEIISVALGLGKKEHKSWFARHIVDPRPLLKAIDLL
ncbi:MAG: heterodisulfide reductase-related iron-sulfur binding cluster [Desulfobacterales bacterium]|nr:heterodisulfide reductase-related iron-sulfur binding cluster [Desulfobacterales bacterium]